MESGIEIEAKDGYGLAAKLFEPEGPARGAVVIASAMGVPQRYYRAFATHLAGLGFRALTFDYRGIGESRRGSLRGFEATLHGWGELDLTAAITELAKRSEGLELSLIGHSVGGQLFGLLEATPVKRAFFVAAQSGYWRHWSGLWQLRMFALWHAAIPGLTPLFGRLPMSRLGAGEDVPAGVGREWARWGRHPEYIGAFANTHGGRGFAHWQGELCALAIADDSFAPRTSVEALMKLYSLAKTEIRVIAPKDLGVGSIGHFGFFKPAFAATLWPQAVEWLEGSSSTAS